jgi:drug/metabolite transporter (DMT)-like permease
MAILTPEHAAPDNYKGALWLLASAVLFSAASIMVKFLGAHFDAVQISFFRLVVSLIIIAPFLLRAGAASGGIRTSVPILQVLRGVVGTLAMIFGFYAIVHLPLADAQAIAFSRTLFLVPLATIFLSEIVGRRRWIAVIVGFIGVLVMLRPGTGLVFTVGAASALAHAFFVAFATILVRIVSRHDKPVTLMFYTALIGIPVTGIPSYFVWVQPNLLELAQLLLMGLFAAGAHNCFIRAYAIGEASAIAPVDYTRLIIAAIAGYLIFDTVPDIYTGIGALIIMSAAFYIIRRESRLGHKVVGAP